MAEGVTDPPPRATNRNEGDLSITSSSIEAGLGLHWPQSVSCPGTSSVGNQDALYGVSFQSLLRDASSGSLCFTSDALYSQTMLPNSSMGNVSYPDINSCRGKANERYSGLDEDDYNGGTDTDVPNTSLSGADMDSDHERYAEHLVELNDASDIDDDWCMGENLDQTNNDSDYHDNEMTEKEVLTATALGDCGCVSGCNPDDPGTENTTIVEDGDSEDEEEDGDLVELDLEQEIYIDHDQSACPYKKRKRYKGDEGRPDCRKPRSMGAIERAMRSAPTRKTEHIFEPIVGMVFDSREEAKEFYNMYSWEVGFGVKYNNRTKNGSDFRSMQDIVCQKQGYDTRITKGSKRYGCKARIHLLRTADHGWYISSIEKEHNHPLSITSSGKREWTSHKEIDEYTKDMIRYLKENSVSPTKIHCIMGSMFGSLEDVPWTKRSIRTICSQIARDQMDDDVRKTMEIFRRMREEDPGFQFSVD